jgi:hypothetical protein
MDGVKTLLASVNKAAERAAVSPIPAKLCGGANAACGPAEFTAVAGIKTITAPVPPRIRYPTALKSAVKPASKMAVRK